MYNHIYIYDISIASQKKNEAFVSHDIPLFQDGIYVSASLWDFYS